MSLDSGSELTAALSGRTTLPVGPSDSVDAALEDHETAVQSIGQWALVWRRFRRHRLAVIAGRFMAFMVLLAIVGPWIAPPFPPPSATGINPFITLAHPPSFWPLTWTHLMGTDNMAVPVATYVLGGARATLEIGIFGALLAALIGMLIGTISGHFGGIVDALLMRVVDAFLTVPFLPLLMVLSVYLTTRSALIYVALFGLTGWAGIARLVRSTILSLREREFTEAARALGVSDAGIVIRHLLPNTLDIMVVATTLNIAVFILAEAALDYVGAGTFDLTWAQGMKNGGSNILQIYWWTYAFPGAAILLTVLSTNFLGDGMRDALDTSSAVPVVDRHGHLIEDSNGPLARAIGAGFRGLAYAVDGTRRAVARGRQAAGAQAQAAIPAGVRARAARPARATWEPRRLSLRLAFAVGPIALALFVAGAVFLYGHSPLKYSPNYGAPVAGNSMLGEQEYGAQAQPGGGWALAYVDGRSHMTFARTDSSGATTKQTILGRGNEGSQPAVAMRGANGLVAWVTANNRSIMAAHVGAATSRAFPIGTASSQVEHPFVVARPNGGYDILYESGGGTGAIYDIYHAVVSAGGTSISSLQRLTHARQFAFYPRGVYDGSGALDLVYMNREQPGTWSWIFERLDRTGRLLGKPRVFAHVQYFEALPGGGFNGDVIPHDWGIDLKRAPDGSVWIAWDGDGHAAVAHWNAQGKQIVPATVVIGGTEGPTDIRASRALALAVVPSGGGFLYHSWQGAVESYIGQNSFDRTGQPIGFAPQRINYDGGGGTEYPRAGTINGRPAVTWEKIGALTVALRSSVWHPYQSPDLLTHLGLNIGNLAANVLVVVFGSLTLGAGIAMINLLAILAIVVLWFLISRMLPRRIAWPVYALVIGGALLWLFARSVDPPSFILVISGLDAPYGLIAALLGGAIAWWAGRYLFRQQDTTFRAVSMAFTGFYVVAILYAVIFIEGQIGRI